MAHERDLFRRAVEQAYARQTSSEADGGYETRDRIVRRGRRRRMGRALGSLALVAVLATGAVASVGSLRDRGKRLDTAKVPDLGAEKVMERGGPLAASSNHLYVANSSRTNAAGGKGSIARLDVTTGEVTHSAPSAMADPLNIAAGPSGLWLVGWEGDMPVGGEGSPVNGKIQLVDPVSGEIIHDLPREDSAPYDVAAGFTGGGESAWVVDYGRDQLLQLDAGSVGVAEVIQLNSHPNSVVLGREAVWVGSNGRDGGTLHRYSLDGGGLQSFPVEHCLNDLVVVDSSVWAVDYCGGRLHEFDTGTGETLATVEIGEGPAALAYADGLLWVGRGDQVVRVDPALGELVGGPVFIGERVEHIVALNGSVFVSGFGAVYRLDDDAPVREPTPTPKEEEPPEGGTSAVGCAHEQVMCIALDRPMALIGAGFGSAWVGNVGEGDTFGIVRFDAESGEEMARLDTDGFTKAFAADDTWMWALVERSDESVTLQIDPASTEVIATYVIGDAGNIGEASLAAGGGSVWISGPRAELTRVSVANGELEKRSYAEDLRGYDMTRGPLHLFLDDGELWLSYGSGHIGVVDAETGRFLRLEENALGENAYEIIVGAEQVWSPHQTVNGVNVISYAPTTSGAQAGRIELPEGVPIAAATDGASIWVLQQSFQQNSPGWVLEIDPIAHRVIGEGLELDLGFRGDIAVGDGYVWVTGNNVLYRIQS